MDNSRDTTPTDSPVIQSNSESPVISLPISIIPPPNINESVVVNMTDDTQSVRDERDINLEDPRLSVYSLQPTPGTLLLPDSRSNMDRNTYRKQASRSVSRRREPVSVQQPIYINSINNISGNVAPGTSLPNTGLPTIFSPPVGYQDPRCQMGVYIPQNNSNSSSKKDENTTHRHVKPTTWFARLRYQLHIAWENLKTTYWHVEPWVVRPLVAGFVYNFGIQLARISLQNFFPSYFPTTVYLPLRADAQFYNLHNHTQITPSGAPSEPSLALSSSSSV